MIPTTTILHTSSQPSPSMGTLCSRRGRQAEPTAEFYPDKVVKFAVIAPVLLIALIALIVLYGVDKVKCSSRDQPNYGNTLSEVNDYCWNNPRPANLDTRLNYTLVNGTAYFTNPPANGTKVTYNVWVEGAPLHRHKIFPILLICQCTCLAIPLLIWHWCLASEMRSHTKAIIEHGNILTTAYHKYDRSQLRSDEASVHRQLDNYLEYLSYLLTCKARRLYTMHLIKWIAMLVITVAWLGGNLGMFSPDFVIFRDRFTCLYDSRNQITYNCYFPTSIFLRVVWYINIIILAILIVLILFHIIVDLCLPRRYQDTYLHRSIPGAMDYRLAHCIQRNYNSRYYWMLSKLCDENEHLCNDPGLSKSLARKYGTHAGGHGGYGDKSAVFALGGGEKRAFVKQTQVDRFLKAADNPDKSSPICGGCCGGGCLGAGSPEDGQGAPKARRNSKITDAGLSRTGPPESGMDDELLDYYMAQKLGRANGELASEKRRRDSISSRPKDYTPDHLYFRELVRYNHPDGLNPEFPVDHHASADQNNRQVVPYRSYKWRASPRKVVFRVPRRPKLRNNRRQRRQSTASRHSDVIILEDLEEYPNSSPNDSEKQIYGGDYGKHYSQPYGGALSSRVLMPYYDTQSGTYKDLNPLAFKIRQKVRKTMSRNMKIWKP
ncbi:uncharacterized protein LOC135479533 [Liolophura sinensis]|uniref:uncharacterized protein LOC135479533 n=1 Tax=Liolophura sinensis TaxID=3198878 RepID=UPI00315943B3